MGPGGYRFEAERAGDTAVARLAGEIDMAATFRIEPELERLTRENEIHTLVIDVSGVQFMDSTALGLLLATQGRLQAAGIRFLLADPPAGIQRILDVTGAGEALSVTTWPPRD
jgi:anti-anti-sigma factor